jgi:hypothetical protein
MLRAAADDSELALLERTGFGVSHDALGGALCESWGLGAAAVASVRHHVGAQATLRLPDATGRRAICALSVLVHALDQAPQALDETAEVVAPQVHLDTTLVVRALRQVEEQLSEAQANGR